MKSRFATPATPVAGWLRPGVIWLAVLLGMVLIGIVLASMLYRARTSAPIIRPAVVGAATALDQHERHPNGFTNIYAPLDQHERHPATSVDSYALLDQQERHPASLATSPVTHDTSWPRRRAVLETIIDADIYAPLDQHERHPALFALKAERAALPDALDRYLAVRDR